MHFFFYFYFRYYRSGIEMIRMANVYYDEGSLENAYVLYIKFMTLFLEKIRKHPDFLTVPVEVKARNQAKLREVLPKAEKLKQQLLEQYKDDYRRYLNEVKNLELERKKKESIATRDVGEDIPSKQTSTTGGKGFPPASLCLPAGSVRMPDRLDDITYPDPDLAPAKPTAPLPSAPPPSAPSDPRIAIPAIDRSTKPFTDSNDRFDSGSLRAVIVPGKVMTLFQAMAQSNTFKNIETCGILAGKLEQNELIVTHMIIPKQRGTSDSCTTTNEEEIFDYQDQLSLITLGWIHTHPTQTAFLSSVDLHTHCPYQLLLPEAVAVVCAPRYGDAGFFALTPDHGLKFIASCRKTGFHPHPTEPPLFEKADHVRVDQSSPLEVVDLRDK
ncbi:unnamed protein product [Callosobruchus maculatus]|uniref:MPN domain-containing protein n=1 Tax=Callosobruchus maculatus TaxID=64391 RepID=A0A653DKI2_CALMS|nr:unnamed protein product [Callosobruchus maculatus]